MPGSYAPVTLKKSTQMLIHSYQEQAGVCCKEVVSGKTFFRDFCTRRNSTFDMLERLLEIRSELNQVLEDLSIGTLLTSDWAKLENLVKLLETFAIHKGQLQSDSPSLSQVVPFLLNPEAHLLTIAAAGRQLAHVLLKSLRERFAAILSPDSLPFDATPAEACLLDPSV